MINFKQMELSQGLFGQLQKRFPEVELVEIVESPVSQESIRVRLIKPADDNRRIELSELAGEISTEILLNYGYHIIISSASKSERKRDPLRFVNSSRVDNSFPDELNFTIE
jgi:hypothetical protein